MDGEVLLQVRQVLVGAWVIHTSFSNDHTDGNRLPIIISLGCTLDIRHRSAIAMLSNRIALTTVVERRGIFTLFKSQLRHAFLLVITQADIVFITDHITYRVWRRTILEALLDDIDFIFISSIQFPTILHDDT